MKHLTILTITLAALTAKGQDTNQTQKILIGFNFSPDYSFRTLQNDDGRPSTDLVINSRNNIEVAKFGYTTGLNVRFNCSQFVAFETGLQFSNKGYKTKNLNLIYSIPEPGSPIKAEFMYAYQYIGIPLQAKLSFGKSKVRFVSSIGVMTNFLLNIKQTAKYEYANGITEKKSQSSKSGFKTVDISPMISVGIDYKLNNKIHLLAEPTYRYGVVKTKDAPVTEHLWNVGLNLGLLYALK